MLAQKRNYRRWDGWVKWYKPIHQCAAQVQGTPEITHTTDPQSLNPTLKSLWNMDPKEELKND